MPSALQKLDEPRRWIYLVAAVPTVLAALYAIEANAHYPYLAIGALLLAFFFWPNRLGWWLTIGMFGAGAALAGYSLVTDMVRLANGETARVLVDGSDGLAFFIWLGLLIVVLLLLWWARPWRESTNRAG